MPGILYTAYQKFYSALSSLERFNKENNFFDNIASLDTFFSEYRAVTFVLQKSLAHTEYEKIYEKNRDEYLSNSKWFVAKRNEITKEHPFRLAKEIKITCYFPYGGMNISTRLFTVENDVEFSSILDEIKDYFDGLNLKEIFFSVDFNFYERDTDEDLYNKLLDGIVAMQDFLKSMQRDIGEKCEFCDALSKKISEITFCLLPRDMLLNIDYAFYPGSGEFEKGDRMALVPSGGNNIRLSLRNLDELVFTKTRKDYFEKFMIMNLSMQTVDIMPTVWLIYEDDTFSMDVYNSSIKTTFYRKINEVSKAIIESDIKEIMYMMTYTLCDADAITPDMTSKDRVCQGVEDYLVFFRIDKYLNVEEYAFEGSKLKDYEYISRELTTGKKEKLDVGRQNLLPVIKAFEYKRMNL